LAGQAGRSDFGFGVQDAPIFQFTNASARDITNASFAIFAPGDNLTQDTFPIGTIAAGSLFNFWVGFTSDGGTGTRFSTSSAGGLDISDSGLDSDAVQFEFLGTWNGGPLTSGIFAAGESRPSLDGTAAHLKFLGGFNGADGPGGVASLEQWRPFRPRPRRRNPRA
jgi:hypothetical protein